MRAEVPYDREIFSPKRPLRNFLDGRCVLRIVGELRSRRELEILSYARVFLFVSRKLYRLESPRYEVRTILVFFFLFSRRMKQKNIYENFFSSSLDSVETFLLVYS